MKVCIILLLLISGCAELVVSVASQVTGDVVGHNVTNQDMQYIKHCQKHCNVDIFNTKPELWMYNLQYISQKDYCIKTCYNSKFCQSEENFKKNEFCGKIKENVIDKKDEKNEIGLLLKNKEIKSNVNVNNKC